MARLPRLCPQGMPLHIIQRGNNRQISFICNEDYRNYLGFLLDGAMAYGVDVHAWVLMTKHVHLLATSHYDGSISKMVQYVGRYYVRYFNQQYRRTGTLWEGRFKSCLIDSDQCFLTCQRYIELNPVRAGIVNDPGKYPWSSYQSNALGLKNELLSKHEIYLSLGWDEYQRRQRYRDLFEDILNVELVDDLRNATNSCMAFGSAGFKEQVEQLYQRRVKPEKPGPKPQ